MSDWAQKWRVRCRNLCRNPKYREIYSFFSLGLPALSFRLTSCWYFYGALWLDDSGKSEEISTWNNTFFITRHSMAVWGSSAIRKSHHLFRTLTLRYRGTEVLSCASASFIICSPNAAKSTPMWISTSTRTPNAQREFSISAQSTAKLSKKSSETSSSKVTFSRRSLEKRKLLRN